MTGILVLLAALLGLMAMLSASRDTYNHPFGAALLALLRPVAVGTVLVCLAALGARQPDHSRLAYIAGDESIFEDASTRKLAWETGAKAIGSGLDVVGMRFTSDQHEVRDPRHVGSRLFHGKRALYFSAPEAAVLRIAWETSLDPALTGEAVFLTSSTSAPLSLENLSNRSPGIKVRRITLSPGAKNRDLELAVPTHWFAGSALEVKVGFLPPDKPGSIELEADRSVVERRPLEKPVAGETQTFSFTYRGTRAGPHTLRARILDQEGKVLDEAGALVTLRERPEIVYLAMAGSAQRLLRTLEGSGYKLRRGSITELLSAEPMVLRNIGRGDLLILDSPSPGYLGPRTLRKIRDVVAGKGASLLYLPYGGSERTGLEALQDLLPVYPGPPPASDQENNLALVCIVDTSFSMFDPQVPGGVRKIEMAKKALLNLSAAMGREDRLGIMGTDLRPYWVTNLKAPRNPAAESRQITRMTALGPGINFYSSLLAASRELESVEANIRHILVLLDTADVDEYTVLGTGTVWDLLRTFREKGITVSLVGFGGSGDEHVPVLNEFAEKSGGFLYLASRIQEIPGFFVQDLEQIGDRPIDFRAMKTFFQADDFPTLTETPPVRGQVIMSLKPGARRILWTERGLPLLAQWGIGIGTTAVLGMDSGGILAGSWTGPGNGTLWDLLLARLVPETNPVPRAFYQTHERGFRIRYRSENLLPGSKVTGLWYLQEGEPLMIEFTVTGPGEYSAFLEGTPYRSSHLEMRGEGPDGTVELASLTIPALPVSDLGGSPEAPSFAAPHMEPDPVSILRDPLILRLLLLLVTLLVVADELFRAPTMEE